MVENLGAGEIFLTSVNREGTWSGFDINLIKSIATSVSIHVVAHGGASKLSDISDAIYKGKASAVALGSMVVYQNKGMGVLINFPTRAKIKKILGYKV